jgi:hypothetical protein
MDLIFDTQVLRRRRAHELPEPVIASIAGYYHRATTTSRPMSLLIALVMVILLAALGFHALRGDGPGWLVGVEVVLSGVPILLAMVRTVPNADGSATASVHRPNNRASPGRSAVTMWCASPACRRFSFCGSR